MVQTAEEWFSLLPPVTRAYLVLSFLTTIGCSLDVISTMQLYYNPRLIWQGEVWRLFTNFFYFGTLGVDFVFQMFLLVKYCRSLEEGSFRSRSADFLWMLLVGSAFLNVVAPFINIHFLGQSLTFMMVYVWARRNQYVTMSMFGLFNFQAPYLPWVLVAFSMLLGASPVVDLLGIAAGHIYYFLEDVYPQLAGGRRLLKTPAFMGAIFGETNGTGRSRRGGAQVEWGPDHPHND